MLEYLCAVAVLYPCPRKAARASFDTVDAATAPDPGHTPMDHARGAKFPDTL
jgi:hypothetical protein